MGELDSSGEDGRRWSQSDRKHEARSWVASARPEAASGLALVVGGASACTCVVAYDDRTVQPAMTRNAVGCSSLEVRRGVLEGCEDGWLGEEQVAMGAALLWPCR